MLIAGIIAEYNPFHNGHALHISATKQLGVDAVIAVMSSDFVQRGEPAVLSKFERARAAIVGGADLVVELPVIWSTGNAQSFAMGAVSLLKAMGCVDYLSFGSECGNVSLIESVESALRCDNVTASIKKGLKSGISFAKARENAVRLLYGDDYCDVLRNANDTLAVEYIAAIGALGSTIAPLAIKRYGANHDAPGSNGNVASSSLIRTLLPSDGWERYVPTGSAEIIRREIENNAAPVDYKKLENSVLLTLRRMNAFDISQLPDISEGLENRVYSAARQAATLDEFYSLAKTKRYTHARIRRIALHALLGITADAQRSLPPYVRVLAAGNRGGEVLKKLKITCSLPVVTRWSDIKGCSAFAREVFDFECSATDIFSLAMPTPAPCGADFKKQIYFGSGL